MAPHARAQPGAQHGPAAPADLAAQPQPPASAPPAPPYPGPAAAPAPTPGPQRPKVPTRPLDAAIETHAGQTCLDRDMLLRRTARWLERDVVDARIRVVVRGSERESNAVVFVIHVGEGHRAERAIHDAPADCDQFHSALALSIALAIEAALMDAERKGALQDDLPSDEELLEKPSPAYFRLGLALFGHAGSGVLTDVAPAASARLELGFVRWLDLRLGAFASRVTSQRLSGVDGEFAAELVAARLDACAAHSTRELRLRLCAGGMLGTFRTRGQDFSLRSIDQAEVWPALVTGFELQAEIAPWFALGAGVDVLVPLRQRRIVARRGEDQAVSPRELAPVGILIGAGPVFRLF